MTREWEIHFENSFIKVETESLGTEILDAPNGDRTYVFETPSDFQQDQGNIYILIYGNEFYAEWKDGNNKIIKSITIPGRTYINLADNKLIFCIRRVDLY